LIDGIGCTWEATVDGVENGQPVEFGFVARSPAFGRGLFLRGTDDDAEAIRDMEAIMAPCPLVPGGAWHAGFAALYLSLAVPAGPFDLICGHSLGCPLAQFLALSHGAKALHLFAPPKPGNEALAAAVRAAAPVRESYAMRLDWVPRLPFYVPLLAPFVPVDDPTELDPASVTPAVGLDPLAEHELVSYTRVLQALP
jgi:pimeloyl-ACP methyl ester carboxylesterase